LDLARSREGARIGARPDQYERIGHLLGMHERLRLLFGHSRDMVYSRMKQRNRAFGGMTLVEAIRE
jgi:hypothetical protein